ncbi:MAG: SIR2 family protein [Anaeromyxobacteraceae bacterium]|nr:SIR2 family protein [Anaeromyxobacteraceae bacterium]
MENQVVWVLGAGFSRSLGGPLLRDLLTEASYFNILAAFPGAEDRLGVASAWVRKLYNQHRYLDEREPRSRLWRDAEEFLELLDAAASGSEPTKRRLLGLNGAPALGEDPIKEAARAARRFVAAECSAFLKDADLTTERWQPYKKWLEGMSTPTTVVTFNYDLVLEKLGAANGGKLSVAVPGQVRPMGVDVLKLHGSVDWEVTGDASPAFTAMGRDEFPLECKDADQLVIASPGPTKQRITGLLSTLWRSAEAALEEAQAVVFVGYRFPPTDPDARHRLLAALARNRQPYLAIHTVLGTDVSGEDSRRLLHLLRDAMRKDQREVAARGHRQKNSPPHRYNLVQHPMRAEDFIGLMPVGHLLCADEWWPGEG